MADIPPGALDPEHGGLTPRLARCRAHLPRIYHRRINRTRCNAIDPDALWPVIDGHRPREGDHCTLRGRIGGEATRPQGGYRRDINDGAAARCLLHRRDRMARGNEHAVDIDPHDLPPLLRSDLGDAAGTADADIVVETIEAPESRDRRVDHRACLLLIGNIGDKGGGGAAIVRDHRYGPFGPRAIEIDDEDLRTGAREQDRRCTAIANPVIGCAASGDDRYLSVEPECVPVCSVGHRRPSGTPVARVPRLKSGVAALLAPEPQLLLYRPIGIAEQHRLVLGLMAYRHPAWRDKDVVRLPAQDLLADPGFAATFDRDIDRAVGRTVGAGREALRQQLNERADRRHRVVTARRVDETHLVTVIGIGIVV